MTQLPSAVSKPQTHHLVVEIFQISDQSLIDGDLLVQLLQTFCRQLNLHIVSSLRHQFQPQGYSVIFILQESHLAVHSWPEAGYLHLDILTCGAPIDLGKIQTFWQNKLPDSVIKIVKLKY